MSVLSRWATNQPYQQDQPYYTLAEREVALSIFRDSLGIKADPEHFPAEWATCLEYARQEIENDRYDMDQEERTGAPSQEGN